jgi:predicted aspartyl protease
MRVRRVGSRRLDGVLCRGRWQIACLLVCLLCCGMDVASPAHAQLRFITEYLLDRDSVEVPFEYKDHQIFVTGTLDKRKNLTFLFDTGASAPVIDRSLDVDGYKLADTTIQEAEGITSAESIWVSELGLGAEGSQAHVHNIAVLVTDLSAISRVLGRKVDGIIGIPFCAGYVTEIDYEKHLLHFYNQRNYSIAQRVGDNQRSFVFDVTPMNLKRPTTVLVSGQLHSKYDYDFILDTGFGGYLSVAHAAAQESGLIKEETPRVSAVSYGVTRSFRSDKIRASFLMLGGINLSGKVVAVDYRNNDIIGQTGIVGNRLLQNYRVTLDYPRKKLLLERITMKEEADDAETPSLGLSIRAGNKLVLVDNVKKNSPAFRAGMRPGDEIVSINDHDTHDMSAGEVTGLLSAGTGTARLVINPASDPNLGTRGKSFSVTLAPRSPLDWQAE